MPPIRRKTCQKSLTTLHRRIRHPSMGCIRCPGCEQVLTPNDYYFKHARNYHGLDIGRCCLFCFGEYCWDKGERLNRANVEHVERCLGDFVCEHRVKKKICNEENNVQNENNWADDECNEENNTQVGDVCNEENNTQVDDLCNEENNTQVDDVCNEENHMLLIPICKCCEFVSRPLDMRGREKEPIEGLYEINFGKPWVWAKEYGIRFNKHSGLDQDLCAIVQRYFKQDLVWIHAMVKADIFEKFVKVMTRIRDEFIELPFGCLCDGMKGGQTHRHMILAYEKNSKFMKLWKNEVKYDTKNGKKSGDAKKYENIKNVFHLIRTIQYVSTPKATCDRGIPKNLVKAMQDGVFSQSHFCINRPMSDHAIAVLALLIPNGIQQLLWEQNRNKHVVDWEELTVKKWSGGHGKWCAPIHKTRWKFENCVIPVDPLYEPTEEKTDFVLRLHGNKKLYFKKNPALLDMPRDEWAKYQASKGNTFRSINDEYYELAQNQQKTMNQLKKLKESTKVERDAYWMSKMEDARKEKQALLAKNEMIEKELEALRTKMERIEKELEVLRAKMERIEKEGDALRVKMEMIERSLDTVTRERDTWCEECAVISKEKDVITSERDTLRTEKIILSRERDSLRTEYAIMIRERDTIAREKDNLLLENALLKERISSIS